MLDIWESKVSNSKAIKIGWWIAVTLIILLIYRRLSIDLSFIIIGFVVCIIYLFSFAADNGAEIDPDPIYTILAWIIFICIVYVLAGTFPYGSLIILFIGMISLIIIIACMSYISSCYPSMIIVGLAIVLLIVNLLILGCNSLYEWSVAIVMLIITIILATSGYVKESLLVLVIAGFIIGLGPTYSVGVE